MKSTDECNKGNKGWLVYNRSLMGRNCGYIEQVWLLAKRHQTQMASSRPSCWSWWHWWLLPPLHCPVATATHISATVVAYYLLYLCIVRILLSRWLLSVSKETLLVHFSYLYLDTIYGIYLSFLGSLYYIVIFLQLHTTIYFPHH